VGYNAEQSVDKQRAFREEYVASILEPKDEGDSFSETSDDLKGLQGVFQTHPLPHQKVTY
jgi:hypothetical protein